MIGRSLAYRGTVSYIFNTWGEWHQYSFLLLYSYLYSTQYWSILFLNTLIDGVLITEEGKLFHSVVIMQFVKKIDLINLLRASLVFIIVL